MRCGFGGRGGLRFINEPNIKLLQKAVSSNARVLETASKFLKMKSMPGRNSTHPVARGYPTLAF